MKIINSKRCGFTLVEVLVVVAVILVLAAVSFSLSGKAIGRAQAAQCVNNMRQTIISHLALAQENNGTLVHTWKSKEFGSWQRNWTQYHTVVTSDTLGWRSKGSDVNSEMRTLSFLQCPTAYALHRNEMSEDSTHNGWRTYSLNQKIGQQATDVAEQLAWIDGARTVDQVEDPTKLILLVERAWDGMKYPAACGATTPAQAEGFFNGHEGFTHVGYFDGHVEKKKPEHVPVVGATLANGQIVKSLGDPEVSLIWRGSKSKR